MDIAIGLLRIYMNTGVVDETALTPLFTYLFASYPDLTLEEQIKIFMDITKSNSCGDYPNTWLDLGFPED